MKDRIKSVRIDKGMSQSKFAEKLSISRSAVCKMESGENSPSEQTIRLICAEFGVNEDWLRNGNGDMYPKRTRNQEISDFINGVMESVDDDFRKRFILALMKLDENQWDLLESIADNLKKED